MKVVFIGAGNVATNLAKALFLKSFDIIQIYSRTIEAATALAKEVNAEPITDLPLVSADADLYIFSIKDSVLEGVASQIPSNSGLWVHTAGSISLDVLSNYTSHYGVLYPFQTFSKNKIVDWIDIPIFIEASDSHSLSIIRDIAQQLSDKVDTLVSDERKQLHLTGVFACNFVNHMYSISKTFLDKINLPFDVLLPLINETAKKVHTMSPQEAQTGPALRYDENVIEKHLHLIEDDKIKEIYKLLSENIHRMSK